MSAGDIKYSIYQGEHELKELTDLIEVELSEPYTVFTYRYFVNKFPELCFLARDGDKCVGGVICKIDLNKNQRKKGYIGMLVVDNNYRGRKIGTTLVRLALRALQEQGAVCALLETETNNLKALGLYEHLGFVRTKLLRRYYLNNSDAYRLKFWFEKPLLLQQQEAQLATESINETNK